MIMLACRPLPSSALRCSISSVRRSSSHGSCDVENYELKRIDGNPGVEGWLTTARYRSDRRWLGLRGRRRVCRRPPEAAAACRYLLAGSRRPVDTRGWSGHQAGPAARRNRGGPTNVRRPLHYSVRDLWAGAAVPVRLPRSGGDGSGGWVCCPLGWPLEPAWCSGWPSRWPARRLAAGAGGSRAAGHERRPDRHWLGHR